ncbi:MAG: site-specific DNA-methyltransferase [Nanoarchaeota archaeon]|nr:site-specific DNA-methyltransferase [Nanoarchaeota archaeon]
MNVPVYPLADWRRHGQLATFTPNRKLPVYNWLYYKEGYARDLVWTLLDRFKLNGPLLDPFCGSGTTLLACAQRGIPSVGYDVQSVALLASLVKTTPYDRDTLKAIADALLSERFVPEPGPVLPIMKRAFSKHNLADVLFWKKQVDQVKNPACRNFFLLALITAAMKGSWLFKDGGVLKVKKRPVAPVKLLFKRTVRKWIKELGTQDLRAPARVVAQDARHIEGRYENVITSPPYLNNIDYTKVYQVENWFLGATGTPIRSWIGNEGKQLPLLKKFDLPYAAHAYFSDMNTVLKEMHKALVPGGRAALVVGNAYFAPLEQHVEVDFILSFLAEKIGFSIEEIGVLQERYALQRRTVKRGTIRESCVMLQRS